MNKYDHTKGCKICACGLTQDEHDQVIDVTLDVLQSNKKHSEIIQAIEMMEIPERIKLVIIMEATEIIERHSIEPTTEIERLEEFLKLFNIPDA